MENKIDQLMKALLALAQSEDNILRTIVAENVIPPQVSGPAQAQPKRIPVENPAIQKHLIIWDGHTSPHDAIEYHRFALPTPNLQG